MAVHPVKGPIARVTMATGYEKFCSRTGASQRVMAVAHVGQPRGDGAETHQPGGRQSVGQTAGGRADRAE